MRTRRHPFFMVMVLAALGALFAPLASFAASCSAPCPMMNAAILCAAPDKNQNVVAEHAQIVASHLCNECEKPAATNGNPNRNHCDDERATPYRAFELKSRATQNASSPMYSRVVNRHATYRVLDKGCDCHVAPASPLAQAAFQAPLHASDVWAIVPARISSLALPLVTTRGFLPLCHAPPRPGVALSRSSRAPPAV